jgi:hypothetical protein
MGGGRRGRVRNPEIVVVCQLFPYSAVKPRGWADIESKDRIAMACHDLPFGHSRSAILGLRYAVGYGDAMLCTYDGGEYRNAFQNYLIQKL